LPQAWRKVAPVFIKCECVTCGIYATAEGRIVEEEATLIE